MPYRPRTATEARERAARLRRRAAARRDALDAADADYVWTHLADEDDFSLFAQNYRHGCYAAADRIWRRILERHPTGGDREAA